MISSERRSECEPGEERDSGKEGQEPATRKRRWGDELTDKVQTIESEIKGLNQLAASHSVSSYLADLLLQFDRISGEVKHRLQELNHLEAFLKVHMGSACSTVNCSYFSVLPPELNLHILTFLNAKDLASVALVNREWHRLASDEALWKGLCDKRWRARNAALLEKESSSLSLASPHSAADDYDECSEDNGRAKKRHKRSWKDVFEYRKRLDDDWRTGAYSRVVTLVGHESQVCCCQYDDEKIISGSFDATVKVWDIRNLEEKDEIKAVMALNKEDTQNAHRDRVLCLMFKDDILVTGGRDETVKIWDLNVGKCVNTLVGHTDNVWYLQFDDDKIISGSADKTMCFWDFRSGKCFNTLVGHERGLSCLHFEDDLLMSGSADRTIKLWDLRTMRSRDTLTGHTDAVYCLYYHNNRLISGGEDRTARVWDLELGRCVAVVSDEDCPDKHTGAVYCMQFDDRRLVTGSFDHTIKLWDMDTFECLHTFGSFTGETDFHASTVRQVQFDDVKMVSASADRTIKITEFLRHD
jgi:WD40 repeat protein